MGKTERLGSRKQLRHILTTLANKSNAPHEGEHGHNPRRAPSALVRTGVTSKRSKKSRNQDRNSSELRSILRRMASMPDAKIWALIFVDGKYLTGKKTVDR